MRTLIQLLLMGSWLIAEDGTIQKSYSLSGDHAVSIHGTFSIHDWSENIEKVTGKLVGASNGDGSATIRSIKIVMETRSIKSDMGAVMNNKTYKALKADANPEITFLLDVPVTLVRTGIGEKALSFKGNLTLAGVSRPVIMSIAAFMASPDRISIEGVQKIRMTDFGIKPPSALFGAMRASPDITINFKINFIIKQQ